MRRDRPAMPEQPGVACGPGSDWLLAPGSHRRRRVSIDQRLAQEQLFGCQPNSSGECRIMPRTVHIKDLQYNRYIVAGDVWDGAVYHQENTQRPNAVWALLLWEFWSTTRKFIGLSISGTGATWCPAKMGAWPISRSMSCGSIDIRAQWTLQDVASQRDTHTLQNGNGSYLYANGSNDGIKLGAGTDSLTHSGSSRARRRVT